LPSLVFRLIVLVGVIYFGTFLLRVTVTVIGGLARSYLVPPVVILWDALTYPLRLPFRLGRRVRSRMRNSREYDRGQLRLREMEEEKRREASEADARERERLAELKGLLKPD
jgi:hypothetical protein